MNLLADDEKSSMEEINEGASLGDDSKMGTNDTSNQTGMLVVKKEGKEYATAINTTPCGHFQNQGKKLVLESDDETLEFLGTHEVVNISEPDMSPPPSCCDQG